jgi:fructoselysine-6-P-deglycase FrlB-like protein
MIRLFILLKYSINNYKLIRIYRVIKKGFNFNLMRSVIEELKNDLKRDFRVKVDMKLEEAYVAGAGDSYAAALCIEGKTKGRFKAIDPYDDYIITKPLIIVSISGRTRSNIALAKKVKGKVKLIVITANENSELARLADELVILPLQRKSLPGTISFLMTLSTLYSISGFEPDKEISEPIPLPHNPFFIGKEENFGIAYYAYLKLAEFFGETSNYERLEQFFHAPVFLTRGRNIVIFSSSDQREDFNANFANVVKTKCKGAFCNALWLIKSIIMRMEKEKWDKIYYLEDKEILNFSSLSIYNY